MKCRLPVAAFAFLAALFGSTRGVAQTTINVGTSATGFASYDPFSGGGGPYPFSNFGVAASANIGGTSVNLVTGGQTSFLFPAFSNGQVIAPNAIGTAIGYTPGWTGSIDSASTLAANATFVYNIGPFSGSNTLFNQNLTNAVSGSLVSGGTLMGGNLGGVSNGNLTSFGYSAGAPFASASATINIGLQYQSGLSWSSTATYGVNGWISSVPYSTAALTNVTSSTVSSGGLNYIVPSASGLATGTQLYLNLQPTVTMDIPITPTSVVSTPITGNLNVQAFGDNIVNYNFPIANPFNLPIDYSTWDASTSWASGTVYSIPIEYENLSINDVCPSGNLCSEFVVDEPTFAFNVPTLGNGSINNFLGGGYTGGWNPGLSGAPLVPNICDPATGICYASNDPNLPVGPAGPAMVTTTTTPYVTTAEPSSLLFLVAGLLCFCCGNALRSRFRGGLGFAH